MKDDLGDRMKRDYESRTQFLLPRRTYTLLRLDGKSFHRYTRDCARPYDLDLMADMDATALALCERIDGARLAYVQSDEISLLLTDFESPRDTAWFDGNLQKIVSLSASVATAHFNASRSRRRLEPAEEPGELAYFDSRAWTMPTPDEAANYFIWRQQDATRNSVTMTARAYFSHGEVDNRSSAELQEMLWRRQGVNWNDLPNGFKRGRVIERVTMVRTAVYADKRDGQTKTAEGVTRHRWQVTEPPIFTRERDWLRSRIPTAGGTRT